MQNLKILLWVLTIAIVSRAECQIKNASQEQLSTMTAECFNKNYNSDTHDGHKLFQIVQTRLQKYRKLLQHLKMHKIAPIQTSPVIKWAQNKQKIFINFKLSHRQDSPPCSDIRHQKFTLQNIDEVDTNILIQQHKVQTQNISKIDFVSQCFFTNQKFKYVLGLSFNASLKSVSIEREGLGCYTIVGEKNAGEIWIDPFQDVHRAAIWQEMRKRFEKDMDEYFEMREKRVQEKQQSHKKKKKKRPTQKQDKKQQEEEL